MFHIGENASVTEEEAFILQLLGEFAEGLAGGDFPVVSGMYVNLVLIMLCINNFRKAKTLGTILQTGLRCICPVLAFCQ